jgi:putative RecB family exonuclease
MKIVPPEHRRVELPRLFGGAGEPGAVEWLLRWELTRGPLERRLIEYGFQSPLRLEAGPRGEKPWFVRIKGRVDRADIDAQGRLHVFDYKSGRAPEPAVTLQVPLYAMCLSQDLNAPVAESAYLSFRDRRTVSRMDFQKTSALLIETYRSIQDGEFPPRPHQEPLCYSCGFVGVCRKQIQEET